MEQPAASPFASALAFAVAFAVAFALVQHCIAFKGSRLCLAACA